MSPDNQDRDSKITQSMKIGGRTFIWGSRTYIMGILNVTPDSFSGDGTMRDQRDWVNHSVDLALQMEDDGADIIDVGGESTRPPSVYPEARPITANEEMDRVLPVIATLAERCSVPISIDSRKASVADAALSAGASMANDVSMLSDPEMTSTISKHESPIVISHIRPRAQYDNVIGEIVAELETAIESAQSVGVNSSRIIVDPGIGFAKNAGHSLEALRNLDVIKSDLGNFPLLVGSSRKSFIGAILDAEPEDRVEGNAASTALAVAKGVDIVRVHEVREMARVAKVADAIVRGWQPASVDKASERVRRAVERQI